MNINDPIMPDRPRELVTEVCDHARGMAKAIHDLMAYGYALPDILQLFGDGTIDMPEEHRDAIIGAYNTWVQMQARDHVDHECDAATGTRKAVAHLMGDAKSFQGAVMFRSGSSLHGELSETPWGGLKMEGVATIPGLPGHPGGMRRVEQFFDYEDVCVVAREVLAAETETSRIIRS